MTFMAGDTCFVPNGISVEITNCDSSYLAAAGFKFEVESYRGGNAYRITFAKNSKDGMVRYQNEAFVDEGDPQIQEIINQLVASARDWFAKAKVKWWTE